DAAREHARTVFHDYLYQAALQANRVTAFAGEFANQVNQIKEESNKIEALRTELVLAAERAEEAYELSGVDRVMDRLQVAYESVSKLYEQARASELKRD